MAKSRKLEDNLTALAQIRQEPTSESGLAVLRQILQGNQSVAIAQAAKVVGEAAIATLIPDLTAAFARLMVKPVDRDPGCLAKQEIAQALYRLECSAEDLFLQGIRHVQMEPVWGGKDDQAAALRGVCALGLVRMNYPDVMVELADLLADAKSEARMAAAQAIAYSENPAGIPLLRLRVKVGDDPAVMLECFIALLKLAPERSLPLVQEFLDKQSEPWGNVELAEATALALGESRLPQAFDMLRTWWQRVRVPELRRSGLLAIAMLRQDTAISFLLALIAEGPVQDATDAIAALKMYRQDQGLWQQVGQAIEQRRDQSTALWQEAE